jgi:hypothetical protein
VLVLATALTVLYTIAWLDIALTMAAAGIQRSKAIAQIGPIPDTGTSDSLDLTRAVRNEPQDVIRRVSRHQLVVFLVANVRFIVLFPLRL